MSDCVETSAIMLFTGSLIINSECTRNLFTPVAAGEPTAVPLPIARIWRGDLWHRGQRERREKGRKEREGSGRLGRDKVPYRHFFPLYNLPALLEFYEHIIALLGIAVDNNYYVLTVTIRRPSVHHIPLPWSTPPKICYHLFSATFATTAGILYIVHM